jgi:hypothetical protein
MNRPTQKPSPDLTPEERLSGVVRLLIEAALAKMQRMKEADEVSEKVSPSASSFKTKERRS